MAEITSEPQVTFASGRVGDDGKADSPPELRILHYNDVYHLDPSSAEPVGGLPRFINVCREYQQGEQYEDQPKVLTLFSGDAFNPSLESTVTKGEFVCFRRDASGEEEAKALYTPPPPR